MRAATLLLASTLPVATLLPLTACHGNTAAADAGLAFPVPAGWFVVPMANTQQENGDTAVRLRNASGACAMRFSRTFTPLALDAWTDDLAVSFEKGGHSAETQPAMSLGGAPAKHLLIRFPNNLIEQVYAVRSGDTLLTLVTVHAAQCKEDFQSTLDAFRV